MTSLLGIDFGTTNFKIHLFDEEGNSVAYRQGKIPASYPQPGWIEQNPTTSWDCISQAIWALSNEAYINHHTIDAIAVTGTSHVTLWNENGKPLNSSILYGDIRLPGKITIEHILSNIGTDRIGSYFGLTNVSEKQLLVILRVMVASKLLWLWEHNKNIRQQVKSWTTSGWDFLNYKLTGQTTYLDNETVLEQEVVNLFNLPDKCWGKPSKMGEIAGHVSLDAARETGIKEGTPVVISTRDSLVSFLGAGITREGLVLNQSGTTDVVAVSYRRREKDNVGYPVESVIPGLWLKSLSPVRGPMVNWIHDLLLPADAPYSELDKLAAMAPPGCDGLLCLPYLCGEKATIHDPQARAVFIGLDRNHSKPHMARSVLEGIAFGIMEILKSYESDGYKYDEIRVGGGGAQSHVWNQIKADVLQSSISILQVSETGCLGAAIIAASTMKIHPTLLEASRNMVHVSRIIEPHQSNAPIYKHLQEAYEMIYPVCHELFPILEEIRNGIKSDGI